MATTVSIQTFAPFPSLLLSVPEDACVDEIIPLIHSKYPSFPAHLAPLLAISTHAGRPLVPDHRIADLKNESSSSSEFVTLRVTPRLLGGKGGFGSQLRAAGGRMSSQKTSNNDSCRDLSGRRLSTIKEAKRLSEYIEKEPERLAAKAEQQRAKLEALEKKLGIDPSTSKDSKSEVDPVKIIMGNKRQRFEDTDYIEQNNQLKEGVKSAVSAALLKKRKKAKTEHKPSEESKTSPPATDGTSSGTTESPLASTSAVPEATPLPTPAAALEAVGA